MARALMTLLTAAFLVTGPPVVAQGSATCFGRPATIVGTDGEDRIKGTDGPDVIVGGDGADDISAGGGDDLVCAGPGQTQEYDEEWNEYYYRGDYVDAGDGDDRIDGGPGPNELWSGEGDDYILGSDMRERVLAGRGNDEIDIGDGGGSVWADAGADSITTGAGDHEINAGRGADSIVAGPGDDEIFPAQGSDTVDAGEGVDMLNLYWVSCDSGCLSSHRRDLEVDLVAGYARGMGNDAIAGFENVYGGGGNDEIYGTDGPNLLSAQDEQGPGDDHNVVDGRGGDDHLMSGTGPDTLVGGEGRDLLTFVVNDDTDRVDLAEGIAIGDSKDRLDGIEDVIATADVIVGDDGPNMLVSTYGGVRMRGGGGDDELRGAEGSDSIKGNEGNDVIYGERGNDRLRGGAGDDTIYGGKGKNEIDGGEGTDTCVRPGPEDGARYCE
ncbi:MAG TPA: calcium-binding protein [Actinomycetota bacterium]|nr:calcium-binding protein [Actinomycetota bacterium]